MNYPLPSYAVSVWIDGNGAISIAVPPSEPGLRGHTLTVPATDSGLRALLVMLKEKHAAPRAKIGTSATPTSEQLKALAKELDKRIDAKRDEAAERARRELEELGL